MQIFGRFMTNLYKFTNLRKNKLIVDTIQAFILLDFINRKWLNLFWWKITEVNTREKNIKMQSTIINQSYFLLSEWH